MVFYEIILFLLFYIALLLFIIFSVGRSASCQNPVLVHMKLFKFHYASHASSWPSPFYSCSRGGTMNFALGAESSDKGAKIQLAGYYNC